MYQRVEPDGPIPIFQAGIFMCQGDEVDRLEVVTMPTLIDAGKRPMRGHHSRPAT